MLGEHDASGGGYDLYVEDDLNTSGLTTSTGRVSDIELARGEEQSSRRNTRSSLRTSISTADGQVLGEGLAEVEKPSSALKPMRGFQEEDEIPAFDEQQDIFGEDLGGYRVSTGRDSMLFSPPEEKEQEDEQLVREEVDKLVIEGEGGRLSGMSQAARAVMGLDDYDNQPAIDFEDQQEVNGTVAATQKAKAKPRAPKRKARPRELQDIPDAPLELSTKDIKATLADTSNILRRKATDPLPLLRRVVTSRNQGFTSRAHCDVVGSDKESERPEEVVCIGARHEDFLMSRHGHAAVPTVTELGLPSVRGLCPELQEVFRMTMSNVLPFPLSKRRRKEESERDSVPTAGKNSQKEDIPEVEDEVELARDHGRASLTETGRPSILDESGQVKDRSVNDNEYYDQGGDVSGMSAMGGFHVEEDNMGIDGGKQSFPGARMSDISFSSSVMGGFDDALQPDDARESNVGGNSSRAHEDIERDIEEEEDFGSSSAKFQPVGAKGRGEVIASVTRDKDHWNSRTSTVYKALNKRLDNKVRFCV